VRRLREGRREDLPGLFERVALGSRRDHGRFGIPLLCWVGRPDRDLQERILVDFARSFANPAVALNDAIQTFLMDSWSYPCAIR
jgi:hypothetical protein